MPKKRVKVLGMLGNDFGWPRPEPLRIPLEVIMDLHILNDHQAQATVDLTRLGIGVAAVGHIGLRIEVTDADVPEEVEPDVATPVPFQVEADVEPHGSSYLRRVRAALRRRSRSAGLARRLHRHL